MSARRRKKNKTKTRSKSRPPNTSSFDDAWWKEAERHAKNDTGPETPALEVPSPLIGQALAMVAYAQRQQVSVYDLEQVCQARTAAQEGDSFEDIFDSGSSTLPTVFTFLVQRGLVNISSTRVDKDTLQTTRTLTARGEAALRRWNGTLVVPSATAIRAWSDGCAAHGEAVAFADSLLQISEWVSNPDTDSREEIETFLTEALDAGTALQACGAAFTTLTDTEFWDTFTFTGLP